MKKLLIIACISIASLNAHAVPITSDTDLNGTASLIDFSQFDNASGVSGPEQIGGLVGEDITAAVTTGESDLWLYNDSWGLGDNGEWNSDRNGYLGIFPSSGPIRIDFNDDNVSGFGFFLNTCIHPDCAEPVTMSAFDVNGVLLEIFDITATAPISTIDGMNDGAFRGIQLATNSIAYIELFADTAVFDDFQFVRNAAAVSEPGTIVLLGLGIAGLGMARRKRAD